MNNPIDFAAEAEDLLDYTRALRRDFHRHPELGFQEYRTAGIVARELHELGLEVSTGIAETGVIALLEGRQAGPTLLLRFDMDALPIQEATGAEYASATEGVMHACGHDGHTAIGLAVARLLQRHQDELSGRIKFVFQPAEEGLGGALRMVKEGVLENPRPDASLALHLWNELPLGELVFTSGPLMAAADTFQMTLAGFGGHGASPHLAIDPVVAAAQVISAVQNIVARNVSPLDSAVVSITALKAGEAFNVIPSKAELKGTIRTFRPEVRQLVHQRLEQVARGVASGLGCDLEMQIEEVTQAVTNDFQITNRALQAVRQALPGATFNQEHRTMGSEDMSYMMQDIPGCYFFVGSNNKKEGLDAPHHNPRFDFDERALPQSVAAMAAAAWSLSELMEQ